MTRAGSNILLAGPSGCGKTLLAGTMAKILNLPFVIVDATSLTEAGYVGDDVEICFQRLIESAGGNIKLAQKGIVYIDEIDKIARSGENRSITRDVSGEGVQQALLKLIEGCEASVPLTDSRKHPHGNNVIFNTSDVLFICGGAFDGLWDGKKQTPFGFCMENIPKMTNDGQKLNGRLTPEALRKFGMLPELIGRLPILCTITGLNEDDLVRILTESEDAVTKEYQLLLKKDSVKLVFENDALREIAKTAIAKKTGARGLRSILEDVMLNIMYEIPDIKENISKCIVTKESLVTKEPTIVRKRQLIQPAAAASP